MNYTTNRPGGSIDVGSLSAPAINAAKNISGANSDFIDKARVFCLIEMMAGELSSDKEAVDLVSCLLGIAHELIHNLQYFEVIQVEPPRVAGFGQPKEIPLCPPWLAPFPPQSALRRLDRVAQKRLLDQRASELMREIEGLRLGYNAAPEYRHCHRMIEQARRRFRKLRDTAMKLGHWTDNRWNPGEEETHLV